MKVLIKPWATVEGRPSIRALTAHIDTCESTPGHFLVTWSQKQGSAEGLPLSRRHGHDKVETGGCLSCGRSLLTGKPLGFSGDAQCLQWVRGAQREQWLDSDPARPRRGRGALSAGRLNAESHHVYSSFALISAFVLFLNVYALCTNPACNPLFALCHGAEELQAPLLLLQLLLPLLLLSCCTSLAQHCHPVIPLK